MNATQRMASKFAANTTEIYCAYSKIDNVQLQTASAGSTFSKEQSDDFGEQQEQSSSPLKLRLS